MKQKWPESAAKIWDMLDLSTKKQLDAKPGATPAAVTRPGVTRVPLRAAVSKETPLTSSSPQKSTTDIVSEATQSDTGKENEAPSTVETQPKLVAPSPQKELLTQAIEKLPEPVPSRLDEVPGAEDLFSGSLLSPLKSDFPNVNSPLFNSSTKDLLFGSPFDFSVSSPIAFTTTEPLKFTDLGSPVMSRTSGMP